MNTKHFLKELGAVTLITALIITFAMIYLSRI